jgi:hypothetical protein
MRLSFLILIPTPIPVRKSPLSMILLVAARKATSAKPKNANLNPNTLIGLKTTDSRSMINRWSPLKESFENPENPFDLGIERYSSLSLSKPLV